KINIASLPRAEALARARSGGRWILGDRNVMLLAMFDLYRRWADANMPKACGQSDDEFSELQDQCMEQWEEGIEEAIELVGAPVSDEAKETAGQLSALLMLMSAEFDGVRNLPDQDKLSLITLARDLAWKVEDHVVGKRDS